MFWWLELYEGPQLWTASISIPHLGHIPVLVSTESTNWTPIDIFQVMAFRIYGSTRKHVRMPQFFWISRHSRGRTEILMRTRRSRMLIIMMMIDHGDYEWLWYCVLFEPLRTNRNCSPCQGDFCSPKNVAPCCDLALRRLCISKWWRKQPTSTRIFMWNGCLVGKPPKNDMTFEVTTTSTKSVFMYIYIYRFKDIYVYHTRMLVLLFTPWLYTVHTCESANRICFNLTGMQTFGKSMNP